MQGDFLSRNSRGPADDRSADELDRIADAAEAFASDAANPDIDDDLLEELAELSDVLTEADRPKYLPPLHRDQRKVLDLRERFIAAWEEFERQMILDEPDVSFVSQDVLRQMHLYVMDRPDVTVAAVVGKAVNILFTNIINTEELPPEVARIILSGRPVEPVEGGE